MKRGDKYTLEGRYYNANYFAVAIVASVTHELDWAAYIGAPSWDLPEAAAVDEVARFGCKLSEEDAKHFFPGIEEPYRL